MSVHSCCCIYFVEWSSFRSNWFYKFFSKGLSKAGKKRFPLPLSISGSAHFFPPLRPAFPPSPFLFLAPAQRQRGPLRGQMEQPAPRASSLLATAADKAVPHPRATTRLGPPVRPVFHLVSEPETSRTAIPRAFHASCPPSARF